MTPHVYNLVCQAIDCYVKQLKELRQQMVGTLYPQIVAQNIDQLLRAKSEIQSKCLEKEKQEG